MPRHVFAKCPKRLLQWTKKIFTKCVRTTSRTQASGVFIFTTHLAWGSLVFRWKFFVQHVYSSSSSKKIIVNWLYTGLRASFCLLVGDFAGAGAAKPYHLDFLCECFVWWSVTVSFESPTPFLIDANKRPKADLQTETLCELSRDK